MNVMQVAIHQIVDVITVWDCFMATTRPMDMILIMSAAIMCWSTFVWVRFGDSDRMFIDMVAVRVMQMPIMEIIDVSIMLDSLMTTTGSMNMFVGRVDFATGHYHFLSRVT